MRSYEQNLHIDDNAFEGMRIDADRILQNLLNNMVEKESLEGCVTIKIDISLKRDYIQNTDPDIEEDTRRVLTPTFTHKINSMMQIKDEAKGGIKYDGMEMVWNADLGEYIIKPIANTTQRTFFDVDFQRVDNEPEEEDNLQEQLVLEGKCVAAPPGPSDVEDEEAEEEVVDDGYSYEEPEDEEDV